MSMTMFSKLDHYPPAPHLVRHSTCRSRSRKRIQDPIVSFCREINDSSEEMFWFFSPFELDTTLRPCHEMMNLRFFPRRFGFSATGMEHRLGVAVRRCTAI